MLPPESTIETVMEKAAVVGGFVIYSIKTLKSMLLLSGKALSICIILFEALQTTDGFKLLLEHG